MEKVNNALLATIAKINLALVGTVKTVSQALIVIISGTAETTFNVGGELSKNVGVLLGVLNDNIARIKKLFDGEPK
jgi:hypothetical protein